jgi:hypothetical protein
MYLRPHVIFIFKHFIIFVYDPNAHEVGIPRNDLWVGLDPTERISMSSLFRF